MAHFLLSAEAKFSAAHTLPGVDVCEQFHGHLWRVRLTIRVPEAALADTGIAVDFRDIERLVETCVADFDHRYLNDLEPFRSRPPSAEHIARVVAGRVTEQLPRVAPVAAIEEVAVWEVPEYRVVYKPT